jgi:hypothetical protein
MGHQAKAEHLRELVRLAKQLRASAAETTDPVYVDMFLRAARGVEERITELLNLNAAALPEFERDIELRGPIDLIC